MENLVFPLRQLTLNHIAGYDEARCSREMLHLMEIKKKMSVTSVWEWQKTWLFFLKDFGAVGHAFESVPATGHKSSDK